VLYNVTKWVDVPANLQEGPATFTAALYSLYGAANSPTLTNYNVSITVGGATSTSYVSSLQN
jgi:Nis1 family